MRIKNLTFNMVPNALRHPAKSGEYLVAFGQDRVTRMACLEYSKKYDAWNADDRHEPFATIDHSRILAWAPFEPIARALTPMAEEVANLER